MRTTLKRSLISLLALSTSVLVTACGGGAAAAGLPGGASPPAGDALDAARATAIADQAERVQAELEAAVAADGVEAAVTQALAALQADATVWVAGRAGSGRGVWWVTREGVPCAAVDWGRAVPAPARRGAATSSRQAPERVLALAPMQELYFPIDEALEAHRLVQQSLFPDFDETLRQDFDADLAAFRAMGGHDLLVITTLSDLLFASDELSSGALGPGGQVVLMTREPVSRDRLLAQAADLRAGRLAVVSGFFAVTPLLVRQSVQMPAGSIVYLGGQASLANDTLADAFLASGAGVVVGWEPPHQQPAAGDAAFRFFAELMLGDTVGEAWIDSEAVALGMGFRGDGGLTLVGSITNPGFEDELLGWTTDGNVGVEGPYGPTQPLEGIAMARLQSLLLNSDEELLAHEASISQSFVVPVNAAELWVRYDVFNDNPQFMEERGDVVTFTLHSGAGASVFETVVQDAVQWQPFQPEVFPDHSDEIDYRIGWQTAVADLEPLQGQRVTLTVRVEDDDFELPSAVLLDAIEIRPVE